ncbi:MAG: Serpin (serine protease inhibitor) [Euryarchaeota archaeon ADurb.BinA087]|nr:MAG: Serpin (serine protease inhibitor) [Euryarchaeota archaeon ADurb.BinA087]
MPLSITSKIPALNARFNQRSDNTPFMNQLTISLLALASLVLAVLFLAGCTSPENLPDELPPEGMTLDTTYPPGPPPGSQQSIVAANNQFALDLYTRLAEDPRNSEENLFFSPFSISSALAITYEGARGSTADEIREVFYFPADPAGMRAGYQAIIAGINNGSSAYQLQTANALWAEQTYPFLPAYISIADDVYGARATNLDFITKPEESRITINQWVEDQTNDKIRDLLPAGSIDSLTRLVITNAVYFKGTWEKQFDQKQTSIQDFRTGDGMTLQVPMMQRTDENATYGYTETDDLQLLRMAYESGSGKPLSMVVLLPRDGNLAALEKSLSAERLTDLQKNLTNQRVIVYFPKFTMETKYSLPATLSAMGMPTAFSPSADLSGMDGTRNLYIGDVIHQAFVDVNEEGTEAAAATAVVIQRAMAPVGPPVPVFRADHPFIFLIQDDETGLILFIGRVEHPESS